MGLSVAVSRRGAQSRGYVVGGAIRDRFRASRRPQAVPMTRTVYARLTKLKTSSRAGFMRRYSCRRRTAPQTKQRALDTLLCERGILRKNTRQPAHSGAVKRRKIPGASLRSAPLHISKDGEQRCFAVPQERAAAEPCREAIGSHTPASGLTPATGKAAREAKHTLLAAPALGSEQRRSGAVPGYPRERRGSHKTGT